MSKRSWILAGALAALVATAAPNNAKAGDVFIGFGVGPGFGFRGWPVQLYTEFEIGYYFDDHPPGGFFLSFSPSASFLGNEWWLVFPLRLGGMFTVTHSRNFSFQLGPTGTVGFALSGCYDNAPCYAKPWFDISIAFMMRFVFADDRVAFYLRVPSFEFAFGGDNRYWADDAIRLVLSGGFQFHF